MNITSRGLRFGGRIIVLLSLVGYALPAAAQTGEPHSVGVPPVTPKQPLGFEHSIIGVQFGVGQNMQQGSYYSGFTGGSGMGWAGSLFFALPISHDLDIGLKAGFNRENIVSHFTENEAMQVIADTEFFTTQMPMDRSGTVTASFFRFEPYAQYQILHSDFFIQIGAGFSNLIFSDISQTRTMENTSITAPDGTHINNPTFYNGSNTVSEQNGEIPGATGWRCSGVLSAGHNFVLGKSTFSPLVTYDYPFSNIGSHNTSNWKIATLSGAIALKFNLW